MLDEVAASAIKDVIDEFIDTFDEYVICFIFATMGIENGGIKLAGSIYTNEQKFVIASNTQRDAKFHAKMSVVDCVEKCKKNGHFSNELAKSLLCTMYSQWDEFYRHRIADIADCDARYIECPLMGDLRKIRNCILHSKSIVPENGLNFEVLEWNFPRKEKLEFTTNMFVELNDKIRGKELRVKCWRIPDEIKELIPIMNQEEIKNFDNFFKERANRVNNIEWPLLQKVRDRIAQEQNVTHK